MQIRKKWLNQLKNLLNKPFKEYYLASFCWWIPSRCENHCTLLSIHPRASERARGRTRLLPPSTRPLLHNWARICKRFRNPGIDSKESIPPAYVTWRASTTNRVLVHRMAESIPELLKHLQIRALGPLSLTNLSKKHEFIFPYLVRIWPVSGIRSLFTVCK
jgi:hypothetical protein